MYFTPHPQFFSRSTDEFGGKVPFIVTDLIAKLKSMNAEKVEGIFRLSGAARDISELASILDQGRVHDWTPFQNVHTVACTLKKYFRDNVRTQPLLPFDQFESFIAIPTEAPTDEAAIPRYKQILKNITEARVMTFAVLFQYLHQISTVESSKMNPHNLAIVIAPNLLSPKPGTRSEEDLIKLNAIQNNAIELMIRLYDKIFDDIKIDESSFITDDELKILIPPPINEADLPIIVELRNIRKKSLIPFVPSEMLKLANNSQNKE
ncbi:Rho GTPase-activating protein 15 [Tritrichomonas musculus]|uniref:Rho GTPase-activating protein 15 n=1 Tax=Tritrichomonas musculus TaxID=1915356 RepID=A0ABR2JKR9_9EUKA